MGAAFSIEKVYRRSEDVVARDIQGEFILIPITSGIAEAQDEIFSLNETGRLIWERIDGKKNLKQISDGLKQDYSENSQDIEADVCGLTEELLKRKMVEEVANN